MTEPDPKDLPAVALRLITTIDGLTKAIQNLLDRAEASERKIAATEKKVEDTEKVAKANTQRVKTNEHKANFLRILLVFDMFLTALGFVLGFYIFHTNGRIDAVCPYAAFDIGTYAPQSRSPGPARDQYIDSFNKMRAKFIELDCGAAYPIVPGAAHPPVASPPG
jgi:hypothetical protein